MYFPGKFENIPENPRFKKNRKTLGLREKPPEPYVRSKNPRSMEKTIGVATLASTLYFQKFQDLATTIPRFAAVKLGAYHVYHMTIMGEQLFQGCYAAD